MSDSVIKKEGKNPLLEQVAILILLIMVLSLALLCAYKYFVKEPPISPIEMELQQLTKQVSANPNDKQSRLLLAFTYQKSGDLTKARKQYQQVLEIEPKELAALYNLGLIAKEEKKYDEAEKFLKQVLEIKETHILGSLSLGEVYIEKSKYDDAIKILDKVINYKKQIIDPRLLKASALEKKGNKTAAIKEYKEVLKYVPDQEEALAALQRLQ